MRYLITVSYDGTLFSGYQKQPKERTVQGELEKALKEISGGKKIDVHASGRTDAGVHAMAQKIHFDLDMNITPEKLSKGLNSLLPEDIFVRKVEEVKEDFHARFSAIGKEYIYILNMVFLYTFLLCIFQLHMLLLSLFFLLLFFLYYFFRFQHILC